MNKAKAMFLNQLEWRKANDVDSVLHGFKFEERDRFFEYYPEGKGRACSWAGLTCCVVTRGDLAGSSVAPILPWGGCCSQ